MNAQIVAYTLFIQTVEAWSIFMCMALINIALEIEDMLCEQ